MSNPLSSAAHAVLDVAPVPLSESYCKIYRSLSTDFVYSCDFGYSIEHYIGPSVKRLYPHAYTSLFAGTRVNVRSASGATVQTFSGGLGVHGFLKNVLKHYVEKQVWGPNRPQSYKDLHHESQQWNRAAGQDHEAKLNSTCVGLATQCLFALSQQSQWLGQLSPSRVHTQRLPSCPSRKARSLSKGNLAGWIEYKHFKHDSETYLCRRQLANFVDDDGDKISVLYETDIVNSIIYGYDLALDRVCSSGKHLKKLRIIGIPSADRFPLTLAQLGKHLITCLDKAYKDFELESNEEDGNPFDVPLKHQFTLDKHFIVTSGLPRSLPPLHVLFLLNMLESDQVKTFLWHKLRKVTKIAVEDSIE